MVGSAEMLVKVGNEIPWKVHRVSTKDRQNASNGGGDRRGEGFGSAHGIGAAKTMFTAVSPKIRISNSS